MATKRSGPVERLMEKALRPDRFIDYRTSWEFVGGLEEVKREIDRLIKTQPHQAVELLETFIAGCYEKAEEIDDSSGSFGMFVGDLFCAWIEARQAAKAAPHATAKQLLGWMDSDDYGFCHGIEKNAVRHSPRSRARSSRRSWSRSRLGSKETGTPRDLSGFVSSQMSSGRSTRRNKMPTGIWPWSRPRNWLRATAQPSPGSTGRAESHMKP